LLRALWLLSDGVGIVAVAPFLIESAQMLRKRPSLRETIEGAAVLAVVALMATYAFARPTESWISFDSDAFALPFLIWLAARWPPLFAIAGAFVVSAVAMVTTLFGIGHLSDVLPAIERVHGVQTTVMMITVFTLILVALFAERRESEEAVRQSKNRLQLALDGAELGALSANLVTGELECDARAARIHGHNRPPGTIKESRRFVHRSDLAGI
jgi:integral membrane sensor domain MASE1